jgi:hypothetical protein
MLIHLTGSITNGVVQDRYFKPEFSTGPFSSISSFNDWVFHAAILGHLIPPEIPKIHRDNHPDEGKIFFTHGDLTLPNILVAGPPGARELVAIVDWEQSGWYPEYWEYCKLLYAVDYEHEWQKKGFADRVMQAFKGAWDAWGEDEMWRGFP